MLKKTLSLFLSFVIAFSVCSITAVNVNAEETNMVNAETMTENVNINGTNSLGNMFANAYSENVNEEDFTGNNIYEIEVENTTAYVNFQALTKAKLIVALYDESTQEMLCTGMKDISTDDTVVQVELDVDTMPQYFVIKAYMLDAETNVPLCKQFECDTYTQAMQELLSKTTEDFEQEKVLTLDEQNDNNFLVYNDETVQTEGTENTNIVTVVDETAQRYIIENIDESISSLQTGDIFSHKYGDEENILILKISSITIDGTTATIYGEEVELEEAFDFIKIDTSQGTSETTVDNSELENGVEYLGTEETNEKEPSPVGGLIFDEELTTSNSLKYKLDKAFWDSKISGNLGCKFEIKLKCYYDAKWGEKDEIDFSFAIKYEANIGINFELSSEYKKEIKIKMGTLTFSPMIGVYITFTPSFVIEGKVNVELNGVLSGQIGKKFKNGEWSDNNKKAEFYPEFKVTGELFVGLSLEPKVGIACNIITASAEAKVGVKIKAELKCSGESKIGADEIHLCTSCIDGDITWHIELSFELKLINNKNLSWKANLFKYNFKIFDFYYSFNTNKFAFSSCPNNTYKQTIRLIKSSNGNNVEGVYVNGIKTDKSGISIIYLTKGAHNVLINNNGTVVNKNIYVNNACEHTFSLDSAFSAGNSSYITDSLKPAKTGNGICGNNAYYTLYADGTLIISGTGSIGGNYSPFEWNNNIKKVKIDDGITSIGAFTFYYCKNLTNISLPNSVTEIDDGAFFGCRNLTNITLPNSVTKIGDSAFRECYQLTKITLPNSITSISGYAFEDCHSLTSITIPNGITKIGEYTFSGCSNLRSITIPNSIKSIGYNAFNPCFLMDVYYTGTEEQWNQINIDSSNLYDLSYAMIHYNSSNSISSVHNKLINGYTEIKPLNNFIQVTPSHQKVLATTAYTNITKEYTRTDLVPNTEAVFMIVRGMADDYEINTSTLLYIAQITVDENGTATFNSHGDFSEENWLVMLIFGECTHSSSKWEMIKESTYTETGLEVCVCDHCGEVIESKEIDVLVPKYPLGDVNNDKIVSIEDATHIQKYLVEIIILTDTQLKNADIDNDGIVSVRDATEIQKYLASISSYM